MKNIMSYEYLWNQVRVLGGAYGCMNHFGRLGNSFFVSYRDPNLEKTLDVYEKAADFIANSQFDERSMTKFIIGAVSDMDTPLTPAGKGRRSYQAYMQGIDEDMLQQERDEVLETDAETVRSLDKYLHAMLENGNICVLGNEEKVEGAAQLFYKTENL